MRLCCMNNEAAEQERNILNYLPSLLLFKSYSLCPYIGVCFLRKNQRLSGVERPSAMYVFKDLP